jgi:hypothetical protein
MSSSATSPATGSTAAMGTQPSAAQSPATQSSATQPTQTTGTAGGTSATQSGTSSNADVMKHVAAIEAMLKMQDDSGGLTLTKAQVEQLRTHWAALRATIEKK